jgi:hypothetical protein
VAFKEGNCLLHLLGELGACCVSHLDNEASGGLRERL